MIRRPPRSTRTDTLFPYTTLFRSNSIIGQYWTMCGGVRGYINQRGLSPIDPATNAPYDVTRYDGTNGTVNLNGGAGIRRSEEHTSELQSLMRISYAVFCLQKKHNNQAETQTEQHKTYKKRQ